MVAEGIRAIGDDNGVAARNYFETIKRLVDVGVVENEGWGRIVEFLKSDAGGLGKAVAAELGQDIGDWKGWWDTGFGGVMLNTPEGEDEEEERRVWSYDGIKEREKERSEGLKMSGWNRGGEGWDKWNEVKWEYVDEEDGSADPLDKVKIQNLEGLSIAKPSFTRHVLPRFNVFDEDDDVGGDMERTYNRTDKRVAIEQLRDVIELYRPTFTKGCVVAGKEEGLVEEILKLTRFKGGRDPTASAGKDKNGDSSNADSMDTSESEGQKSSSSKITDPSAQLVTLSLLTLGISGTFKPLLVSKLSFQLGQAEQSFYDAFVVCVVKMVEDAENLTRVARYRLVEITSTFIKMAGGQWPAWKKWKEDSEENQAVKAFAGGVAMGIVDGIGRERAVGWVGEEGRSFVEDKIDVEEGIEGIRKELQTAVKEITARVNMNLPMNSDAVRVALNPYNDEFDQSSKTTRTKEVSVAVFEGGHAVPGEAVSDVMAMDVDAGSSRDGAVKDLLDGMFNACRFEGKNKVARNLRELVKQKCVTATEVAGWVTGHRVEDLEDGSWDMMGLVKVAIWERGKVGDNRSFDEDEDGDDDAMEEGGGDDKKVEAMDDIEGAFKCIVEEAGKKRGEGNSRNVAINCGLWDAGKDAILRGIWEGQGWEEGKELFGK